MTPKIKNIVNIVFNKQFLFVILAKIQAKKRKKTIIRVTSANPHNSELKIIN